MLMSHKDFPVRPIMEKGESLVGYITRFHGANGYCLPHVLYRVVRNLYRGTPKNKATDAFDAVQSVIDNSVLLDRTWWLSKPCTKSNFGGYPDSRPTLTFNTVRFCPACLSEYGFHFAFWELPLVKACPIHKLILLDTCNNCNRGLSWTEISPNWHCFCGKSISAIRTVSAEQTVVTIAQLLAGSNDVDLPTNFKNRFEKPVTGNYCLSDVYLGLEWIGKLRKVLVKKNTNFGKANYCWWQSRRPWSDVWITKLLVAPPEQLIHRLERVLSRRFRADNTMLCFVEKSDSLNRGILYADGAGKGFFQQKIRIAVEHILTEYRLQLPISSAVFYNPRISNGLRTENLMQFMKWWAAFSECLGALDPEILRYQGENAMPLVKFGKQTRDRELVAVLNLLMNAALQQFDVEKFRVLLYWWRAPTALRELQNPSDVLNQIGSHLAVIPEYEIFFVGSLVRIAWQGKQ